MASSVTEAYSPLPTPTRSSLRQPGVRGGSNSVRFYGITNDDEEEEHTSSVGPVQGRSSIALKQAIFHKYFNEFTTYPLLLCNSASQHREATSSASPHTNRSVRSAHSIRSNTYNDSLQSGAPWTPTTSTHVSSESGTPKPRWAAGRQSPGVIGTGGAVYSPEHVATRPVTTDGSLTSHLSAFEALLSKPWTRKEVQQAQVHGLFRRLIPHLGVERLQGPAALLLAGCGRLHPPLLLPLLQRLVAVLPILINSPRQDVRQAGLCLLGRLWRAASDGPSQHRTAILEAPRLVEALEARAAERSIDALWAIRQLAADAHGAAALERCGALRAVCRALRALAAAAAAVEGDSEAGCEDADSVGRGVGPERPGGGVGGGGSSSQRRTTGRRRQGGVIAAAGATGSGGGKGGGRGSKRAGVTEGGQLAEAAAEGVLVADCLAAFASVHSAALTMCDGQKVPNNLPDPERNRVPARLLSLLIRTGTRLEQQQQRAEPAKNGPAGGASTSAAAASATAAGGASQGRAGEVAAAGRVVRPLADWSQAGRGGEEGAEEMRERAASAGLKGRAWGSCGEDDAGAGVGGGGGEDAVDSEGCGGRGRGGGDGGGAGKEGKTERGPGGGSGSAARKAQRQLLDALLRSLYGIASSGHCQTPQQVVREALRDAGDAAVERLAKVLRVGPGPGGGKGEQLTLGACSAAAYLLWLLAAGEFSAAEGPQLNVMRARLARDAPPPPPAVEEEKRRGGGDGGRYDASAGFGVVPAVAELLLRHLPGWRDPDLGDCVAAFRTTTPPLPPIAKKDVCVAGFGGGRDTAPSGNAGASAGASGGGSDSVLGSARSGGGRPSGDRSSAATNTSLAHGVAGSPAVASAAQTPPLGAMGPGAAPGGDGDGGDATVLRQLAQIKNGSTTGLLLTPRDARTGAMAVAALSPQERYGRGDSSDEEVAAGGGGGGDGNGGCGNCRVVNAVGSGSDGVGDGVGGSLGNTQDLDLSNVIDSSVELTGKEQLMRAIAGAASALVKEQEAGGDAAAAAGQAPREDEGQGLLEPSDDAAAAATAGQGGDLDPLLDSVRGVAEGVRDGDVGDDGELPELPDDSGSCGGGGGGGGAGGDGEWAGGPPSSGSGTAPGSGCTPLGAPAGYSDKNGSGGGGAARLAPLAAARPSALVLPSDEVAARTARAQPPPAVVPSPATWLSAVRFVRQCRIGGDGCAPSAAAIQELQANSVGLLSAIALSASGCRAICAQPGLLSYIGLLLKLPDLNPRVDGDSNGSGPAAAAAAALCGNGHDLRLQLLALLTNLSMHAEGAAAVAASGGSGGQSLPEALYRTVERSIQLVSCSPTGWCAGGKLLESGFIVLTNLQRAHAPLNLVPDPGTGEPRDSFRLAVEALRAPLPRCVGAADRTRLRTAAARMLNSALAAYEGVGRRLARPCRGHANSELAARQAAAALATEEKAVVSELIWLLAGSSAATGGSAVAAAAACDGAAALWQLMASGTVHPDDVASDLEPHLVSVLDNPNAAASADKERPAALLLAALGLVSCLVRSGAIARRLWTSPLLPAVMRTHALAAARCAAADDSTWGPVVECVRRVCTALCSACHREDRGDVVGPDRRVDRWGLTERVLGQLRCRLEFDYEEEGIVLVPLEEEKGQEKGEREDMEQE